MSSWEAYLGIWHVNYASVTFCSTNMSKTDSRVPCSTFDYSASWFYSAFVRTKLPWESDVVQASLLCVTDKAECSAILDTATRILKFGLRIYERADPLR